jgi:hypothetical protein
MSGSSTSYGNCWTDPSANNARYRARSQGKPPQPEIGYAGFAVNRGDDTLRLR